MAVRLAVGLGSARRAERRAAGAAPPVARRTALPYHEGDGRVEERRRGPQHRASRPQDAAHVPKEVLHSFMMAWRARSARDGPRLRPRPWISNRTAASCTAPAAAPSTTAPRRASKPWRGGDSSGLQWRF